MGPIRGLELALSSDTAGLGQSNVRACTHAYVCVCAREHVCVGGLSAGSVWEVMGEKERPGNPLFLFWCPTLLEAG